MHKLVLWRFYKVSVTNLGYYYDDVMPMMGVYNFKEQGYFICAEISMAKVAFIFVF